ncbi:MAG: hypothetical protein ACLSAF_17020 [Intestinimonas sp.]
MMRSAPRSCQEIQAPGCVRPYTDNPLDCTRRWGEAVYLNLRPTKRGAAVVYIVPHLTWIV